MRNCYFLRNARKAVLMNVFLFAISFLSFSALQAQIIPDLSSFQWKSQSDLVSHINAESSRAGTYAATPGLPQEEKVIYLAYGHFLNDLKTRIQTNAQPAEAIPAAYKQLEQDLSASKTFSNANLVYISEELIARLIENLQTPPALQEYDPK